ncbi:MAG: CYTH domain-containing protein [Caldilineaceae bacterium]
MATEIERKFLVKQASWRSIADAHYRDKGARYRQGYLNTDKERTVRVRTIVPTARTQGGSDAQHGYLTIKGKTVGASRAEYEYEIPFQDAEEMLDTLCHRPLIEKIRYTVEHSGVTWEVDEFLGANTGLLVAEVELERVDQLFTKPAWIDQEVTDDHRYFNASLVEHPFSRW